MTALQAEDAVYLAGEEEVDDELGDRAGCPWRHGALSR
jgi:hypothetical protein